MTTDRPARVGQQIRVALMDMLLMGRLKDPGTRGAVVHEVKVSGDLRYARVYVRLGELDASDPQKKALLRGLNRAKGFLKRQIGDRLRLRHTPELEFVWDDATDRATRIESILHELKTERGE